MYKRILIPVDGSTTADRALQEAIRLAVEQQAQLRIINVMDEGPLYSNVEGLLDINELREALRSSGKHILSKAEELAKHGGAAVETALLETTGERIASMIVEDAKHWSADLVVMGTHGRRGFDRIIMGSVAEGLLRITPIPVLLVRGQ